MQNLDGMGWMEIPIDFDALEEEQVPVFNFNSTSDLGSSADLDTRNNTEYQNVSSDFCPVTPSSDISNYPPQTPHSEIPDFQDEYQKGIEEFTDDGSVSEFDFSVVDFLPINQRIESVTSFSDESCCLQPASTPCHSRPSLEGMSTDQEEDQEYDEPSYHYGSESCSSTAVYTDMQFNMNQEFLSDETRSSVGTLRSRNADPQTAQPSLKELEKQMETLKKIIKKRKAEEAHSRSPSTRRARSTEPRSKRWKSTSSSTASSTASSTSALPPTFDQNNKMFNTNFQSANDEHTPNSRRYRHQSQPETGLHPASIVLGSLIPTLERQLPDFNPISQPYPLSLHSTFTSTPHAFSSTDVNGNFGSIDTTDRQQFKMENSFQVQPTAMTSALSTFTTTASFSPVTSACPSTAAEDTQYILVQHDTHVPSTSALEEQHVDGGFLQELLTLEYSGVQSQTDSNGTDINGNGAASTMPPEPVVSSLNHNIPEPILTPLVPVNQEPHFESLLAQNMAPDSFMSNVALINQATAESVSSPLLYHESDVGPTTLQENFQSHTLAADDLLDSIALAATSHATPPVQTDCLTTMPSTSPSPVIKQEVPETTSTNMPCSSNSSVDSEGRRSKEQLFAAAQESVQTGSMTPMVKQELKLTILNRRLAKGQTDIKVEFTPPVKYELTEEEKQKKQHKKNLNRIAAQNHRERKKAKVAAEEKEAEILTARREELLEQVDNLEREKQWLLEKIKAVWPRMSLAQFETGVKGI